MGRKRTKHVEPEVESRGYGWVVVLLGLGIAGYLAAPALAGYLAHYAPAAAAPGDMAVGTWAVVIVLVAVLTWCFSGKGGGR